MGLRNHFIPTESRYLPLIFSCCHSNDLTSVHKYGTRYGNRVFTTHSLHADRQTVTASVYSHRKIQNLLPINLIIVIFILVLFSFKYSLNKNRWVQCPLKMVHQTRYNRFTSLRNQGFVFQTKSSRQYTQEYTINSPRDTTSITFKDSEWGLRVAYQHAWHHTSTSGESHQSSKVGDVGPNSINSNLWSTCDQLVINLSDTDCPTNQANKINNIRILTVLGLGLPEGVNQWYLEGCWGRVSRPRSTGKGGNSHRDGCDANTVLHRIFVTPHKQEVEETTRVKHRMMITWCRLQDAQVSSYSWTTNILATDTGSATLS